MLQYKIRDEEYFKKYGWTVAVQNQNETVRSIPYWFPTFQNTLQSFQSFLLPAKA